MTLAFDYKENHNPRVKIFNFNIILMGKPSRYYDESIIDLINTWDPCIDSMISLDPNFEAFNSQQQNGKR